MEQARGKENEGDREEKKVREKGRKGFRTILQGDMVV